MSLPKLVASPLARQIWVISGLYLTRMGSGMVLGISNSMLPALLGEDSDIPIDLEAASWLNAVASIGCLISFFITCPLLATYGRRLATIIGLTPCFTSPLLCYLATDLKTLLIGRFLAGMGGTSVAMAVIIGEYTSPEYRGVFLNLKSFFFVIGFTLVHILGHYFHWRIVMLVMMIPPLLNLLMVFTWPESPSWLASNHRYDEAVQSFYWMRGRTENSTKEINTIIEAQKELKHVSTSGNKILSVLAKFRKKNFWKPVGVYIFVAMLLETSGRHVFPAYAKHIIQQMDKDKSNVFFYTICIDLLICFSALLSLFLVKILKRRTLLLCSGAASVAVLLAVSLYYYLQSKLDISGKWNPLVLVLYAAYFLFSNVGCTPISLGLIGELFPLEHRSIGFSIAGLLIGIFMFVTLKITPFLLKTIKVYGTFTTYGVCMTVCLLVLYFTLPETKDKTLQEIEDNYKDRIGDKMNVEATSKEIDVNDKLLDKRPKI